MVLISKLYSNLCGLRSQVFCFKKKKKRKGNRVLWRKKISNYISKRVNTIFTGSYLSNLSWVGKSSMIITVQFFMCTIYTMFDFKERLICPRSKKVLQIAICMHKSVWSTFWSISELKCVGTFWWDTHLFAFPLNVMIYDQGRFIARWGWVMPLGLNLFRPKILFFLICKELNY